MSSGRKLALALSGSLLISIGCNPLGPFDADADLIFSVTGAEWATGDTIQVVLRNESSRRLGYNLCTKTLERRVDGQWGSVQSLPENTVCTLQLEILDAGESALGGLVVHPFIEPGTYRFRTRVEWPLRDGGNQVLVSNEFRVVDG